MIKNIQALGFPWQTLDPFLFCAYHRDEYPQGNEAMQANVALDDRNLGQDFELKDGFRMYHGKQVPGFPSHPHRGFETVTITLEGLVDHSDSLGAAGRFGNGDVQWMTAGKGVQHAEMFPLLNTTSPNPLEIFQVWLNLPKKDKMVDPHFSMLWNEEIPKIEQTDSNGLKSITKLVCGSYAGKNIAASTPNSWASDPANEVNICTIELEPGAQWSFPASATKINRSLFFYKGNTCSIEGQEIQNNSCIELEGEEDILLINGKEKSFFLFLQGKAIAEPVAQHGPFVMNTQQEIVEAIEEFQQTRFGGWPWPSHDHVHDKAAGRFALHENGRREERS